MHTTVRQLGWLFAMILGTLSACSNGDLAGDSTDGSTTQPGKNDGAADGSTSLVDAGDDDVVTVDATPETPPLPGGRANFVASVMGAGYNSSWVRLSTWKFSGDGKVGESYWRWDHAETPVPSSLRGQRADTGYNTTGCPKNCDVWTAKGFEPGTTPRSRVGEWRFDSNNNIRIDWPDGFFELYKVVEHSGYAELTLVTHDYKNISQVFASAFGSNASLDQGVTIDKIKAAGSVVSTFHEQGWDVVTISKTVTMPFSQYDQCTGSPSMQGQNPAVYHTYFSGNPATDGRKNYWYSQLRSVALNSTCADIDRGGHTFQLLQALNDDGNFIGWVGAEASLIGKYNGGTIITQAKMMKP